MGILLQELLCFWSWAGLLLRGLAAESEHLQKCISCVFLVFSGQCSSTLVQGRHSGPKDKLLQQIAEEMNGSTTLAGVIMLWWS